MTQEHAKTLIKTQLEGYLKENGINSSKPFRCLNPAHTDTKPSMSYDPKRHKAHCFSCGADYDTFDLIGIDHGLSGNVLFLKGYELFNLTVETGNRPFEKPKEATQGKKEEQDYTAFFKESHQRIKESDYLQQRGISEAVASRFMLGFAPEWTHPKAPTAPISPRLIIPTGKSSYLARDTRATLTDKQKQYSKSKVGSVRIFNIKALQTASKPIFVVEGEIDALSITEVGGEAIALGSTANRRALLKLLENEKPKQPLIIAMDNDKAGEEAASDLVEGLQALAIPFYRVNLYGKNSDANEALLADREALALAVENAERIEDEAKEAEKKKYLETSAYHHIQGFVDGIKDSVNTPYVPTGFPQLDNVLDGGLYEGFYCIGAISSLGKTSFITQICDQIAQSGIDVLIMSLEMARTELMAKSISRHTILDVMANNGSQGDAKTTRGITTGKRYQNYSRTEIDLINRSVIAYSEYSKHIFISEGIGNIGVEAIRESVKNDISFTGSVPVVVVDYLQIVAPHNERATDKQNTDKAAIELKRISRDFKTPVIVISSFNRASYKTPVTMEAFKESGAIEYSSDVLIGLQLKGVGVKDFDVDKAKKENPRKVELVILKNRNGATGGKISYEYYPMFNYFNEV